MIHLDISLVPTYNQIRYDSFKLKKRKLAYSQDTKASIPKCSGFPFLVSGSRYVKDPTLELTSTILPWIPGRSIHSIYNSWGRNKYMI